MTETEFRTLVVRMLAPLYAFKVENIVHDGTPDICCSVGWIETKLGRTQRREDSRVVVGVKKSQPPWHRRWRATGAMSWTLTLVDDEEWALHDGLWAADHLGHAHANRAVLINAAQIYWVAKPTAEELIGELIKRRTTW
jgi:hypothetical protein